MVLEMRDGDKSKLLDKGIQKAVVNINDSHMNCWAQQAGRYRQVDGRDF